MVMRIFAVLGMIWVAIFFLSIILTFIRFFFDRYNEKLFAKKIKESGLLQNIFKTLTPDQIKILKDGRKVEEKIDVIKPENISKDDYTNLILEQFKDFKVGNMTNFIKEVDNWLCVKSTTNNATINDWYHIYDQNEHDTKTLLTFTIMKNNMFLLIAHSVDKGKVIDNVTSFNKISDLETFLENSFKFKKLIKE